MIVDTHNGLPVFNKMPDGWYEAPNAPWCGLGMKIIISGSLLKGGRSGYLRVEPTEADDPKQSIEGEKS